MLAVRDETVVKPSGSISNSLLVKRFYSVKPPDPAGASRSEDRAADPGGNGVRRRRGTSTRPRSSREWPCLPIRDRRTLVFAPAIGAQEVRCTPVGAPWG